VEYAIRIKPQQKVELAKIDPSEKGGLDKQQAEQLLEQLGERLGELLELLFAAGSHGLLVVLQGRDAPGKDGSIRRILHCSNVQTTRVASFKVPTELELSHDFLWRVHQVAPAKGGVTLFNRSHYEDVLVVRVHDLAPKEVWEKRYEHINAFERLLVDSGTIIVKFMLHIDLDEQEQRLLERGTAHPGEVQ
jgi:polyphosphate kinase 2 (PPK2 family)